MSVEKWVTGDRLLDVINVALGRTRYYDDLPVVRAQLKLIESLTHWDESLATHGLLDGPTAALAEFVGRCQAGAVHWEWCRSVCSEAGIDAIEFADRVHAMLPQGRGDCYNNVMPVFGPEPHLYRVTPVADLPHYSSPDDECAAKDVFEKLLFKKANPLVRLAQRLGLLVAPDPRERELKIGRMVQDWISRQPNGLCQKHQQVRWPEIAEAATRIQQTERPWTKTNISKAALTYPGLTDTERKLLRSLFTDPIRWDGITPRLNGGQHRTCGLRVAGVAEVVVGYGHWDK